MRTIVVGVGGDIQLHSLAVLCERRKHKSASMYGVVGVRITKTPRILPDLLVLLLLLLLLS
uniref:Uncharacterized protein n=1 Tax=Octopus bimaculoides TaxID=37653 RepID=A0A0L8I6N5_OCTBM